MSYRVTDEETTFALRQNGLKLTEVVRQVLDVCIFASVLGNTDKNKCNCHSRFTQIFV